MVWAVAWASIHTVCIMTSQTSRLILHLILHSWLMLRHTSTYTASVTATDMSTTVATCSISLNYCNHRAASAMIFRRNTQSTWIHKYPLLTRILQTTR